MPQDQTQASFTGCASVELQQVSFGRINLIGFFAPFVLCDRFLLWALALIAPIVLTPMRGRQHSIKSCFCDDSALQQSHRVATVTGISSG